MIFSWLPAWLKRRGGDPQDAPVEPAESKIARRELVLGIGALSFLLAVARYLPGLGDMVPSALSLAGVLGVGAISIALFFLREREADAAEALQRRCGDAERAAYVDPLTRLPNRLALRSALETHLSNANGGNIALLFADLDRFKEVNDSLGHDAGDDLLEEVSRRFQLGLREGDLLARLGGDEFAAVIAGDDAEAGIDRLAAAMLEAIEQPFVIKGDFVTVGVSIGIAIGQAGSISSEELLRRADIAMYRAKSDNRLPSRHFNADMDEALSLKRFMRNDLSIAIAEDQLTLMLQPLFSTSTGKITSAEALIRWNHPTLGQISPAKLIPLAEESGQILELDDWVLRRALQYAKQLGIPIAINVSPVQFRHHAFAQTVTDRLLQHQVAPELLRVEITEGVLITHTETAKRMIRQLRDIGVKVILDDFGTGFSSLSYLKDFDFDAMKIDRSFLRDIGAQPQASQLLRAIIDLGHSLQMEVVAEGVENEWQLRLLQLLSCDQMQGYHLGTPGLIEKLEAMLAKQNGAGDEAAAEPGAKKAS